MLHALKPKNKKNHEDQGHNWRPTAEISVLKKRAALLNIIRKFFAEKKFIEIETPLLCRTSATDPFIDSFQVHHQHQTFYLQTSPEYAMKRLLCAGMGSIYQISKAFRASEQGRLHNPEFTLLEWYTLGFDHHDLMHQVNALLERILGRTSVCKISYQALFERYFNINPHTVSEKKLILLLNKHLSNFSHQWVVNKANHFQKTQALNLLLTQVIEPDFVRMAETDKKKSVIFIYDFPKEQAALAAIKSGVAERFEVYVQGIELANGYHELRNARLQQKRFENDLKKRQDEGLPVLPLDHALIKALKKGMPPCAGVALGVDRLIMLALGKKNLSDIMAFDHESA